MRNCKLLPFILPLYSLFLTLVCSNASGSAVNMTATVNQQSQPVDNILRDILSASLSNKLVLLPDFCFSAGAYQLKIISIRAENL